MGRRWPSLDVPVKPQRWNGEAQPTIYASLEPEVAAAEKLGHLASSGTLASARAFWGSAPAIHEVLVVSFVPDLFRTSLVDLSGLPDIGDFLTPNLTASQEVAAVLVASGATALRVPSAVFGPTSG